MKEVCFIMIALRLYGPNDIRLEDVPVPEITDGEILLKVRADRKSVV